MYALELNIMSAQEVFNMSARHLLEQNVRSVADGENPQNITVACMYRSSMGTECAAGIFLRDVPADILKSKFESKSWSRLVDCVLVPAQHVKLIEALQYIHDTYYPEDWHRELQKLVDIFNLKWEI